MASLMITTHLNFIIATNSKFLSNGIDSTVHEKYLAFNGIIFSSPVIKATNDGSTRLIIYHKPL